MKPRGHILAGVLLVFVVALAWGLGAPNAAMAQATMTIHQATLGERNPITPEISTEELKNLLAPGSGRVALIDTRPAAEYAFAHIPGAISVGEKEEEQIARAYPDKGTLIVLYCNGPY